MHTYSDWVPARGGVEPGAIAAWVAPLGDLLSLYISNPYRIFNIDE